MAKRFSDTEIWKKKWYCDLSPAMKCFWKYICDSCDSAGVWEMNIPLAEFQIGCKLELSDIISDFNGNIYQLSETKLHIRDFVQFQYGTLIDNNNYHKSVIALLEKHGILGAGQGLVRGLCAPLDKDKDKDKDKEKKRIKSEFIPPIFEEFLEYCTINGYENIAEKAFKYYNEANWKDGKGQKVSNWKQKLQGVWFREENKGGQQRQQYGRQEVTKEQLQKTAQEFMELTK